MKKLRRQQNRKRITLLVEKMRSEAVSHEQHRKFTECGHAFLTYANGVWSVVQTDKHAGMLIRNTSQFAALQDGAS